MGFSPGWRVLFLLSCLPTAPIHLPGSRLHPLIIYTLDSLWKKKIHKLCNKI